MSVITTGAFLLVVCLLAACGEPVVPTRCSTSTDCASTECCVSDVMLDGRKRIAIGGTCRPLGHLSSECLVNNRLTNTRQMYYESCPCAEGLTCKGNGLINVPLGEAGSCIRV